MKQQLESVSLYLNTLSLRERILVLLVLVTVIYVVWDGVFQTKLDQEGFRLQQAQKQNQQQQQQRDLQLAQNTALLAERNRTKKQTNDVINDAREQLKQTQGKLDNVFENLVPPNKITELLRSLLLETNGLTLLSLNNEPAKNITPKPVNTDKKSEENKTVLNTSLYEHAATIKLSGNYQQLYQYLSALEHSRWRLFWDQLQYKVTDYPMAEITIRVHTISTDEHWIGM